MTLVPRGDKKNIENNNTTNDIHWDIHLVQVEFFFCNLYNPFGYLALTTIIIQLMIFIIQLLPL